MEPAALQQYYEFAVLPQFGFSREAGYRWTETVQVGPDETAHHFIRKGIEYILIYEDYGGQAALPSYIEDVFELEPSHYAYVSPVSATTDAPSYYIKLPTPSMHADNVFGCFTLVELRDGDRPLSQSDQQPDVQADDHSPNGGRHHGDGA